jgi:hypothetical protein
VTGVDTWIRFEFEFELSNEIATPVPVVSGCRKHKVVEFSFHTYLVGLSTPAQKPCQEVNLHASQKGDPINAEHKR